VVRASNVRVGLVYPELLGTYGDRGNALVLVERCVRRGLDAELVEVAAGRPIPESLDIYLFGGGEDDAQVMAADGMRASRVAIERARNNGAVIFAVCAGFQLFGATYEARGGTTLEGLCLIDMSTRSGSPRLIGEVVIEPDESTHLPVLTGFENHGGRTSLGPAATPFGEVVVGHGNGTATTDGALAERFVGTYLHGPALPRNPALADYLLAFVIGDAATRPLDDTLALSLRAERLAEASLTGLPARLRDWRLNRG
jgi:lipid II isoglutaminyl synthase (glutamine-hydrolysing)